MERRLFVQASLIGLAAPALVVRAQAQNIFPVPKLHCLLSRDWKKQPGDEGYNHHRYHSSYKRIFAEELQCHCSLGECRQTIFRETKLSATTGFDVVVNRMWYPVNTREVIARRWTGTKMPDMKLVNKFAPELLEPNVAHVCAYTAGLGYCEGMHLECAIINAVRV